MLRAWPAVFLWDLKNIRAKPMSLSLIQQVAQQRSEANVFFDSSRVRLLSETEQPVNGQSAVMYLMVRDCRVQDNWALIHAQRTALACNAPLYVCYPASTIERSYRKLVFLIAGLREVESECVKLNIQFHVVDDIVVFVNTHHISTVLCDFSPLREHLKIIKELRSVKDISVQQVDAHNVVPVWIASNKQEYSARTLRGKIMNKLKIYLTQFPAMKKHPYGGITTSVIDYAKIFKLDSYAQEEAFIRKITEPKIIFKGGYMRGMRALEEFLQKKSNAYDSKRNDPTADALSNLSPWIHFGHVSAQRIILLAQEYGMHGFIEEVLVRRELSDNFCHYNEHYDSISGAPDWARTTLEAHRCDERAYVYTRNEFEEAGTHDDLWNAAQIQMIRHGKMHGFMRMYWAKKILEWSAAPEFALETAIYLNDKYNIDGHDPNGYVGCMWSICGVHDQGWKERPVFGKIRYMNLQGCKRKFSTDAYISENRK